MVSAADCAWHPAVDASSPEDLELAIVRFPSFSVIGGGHLLAIRYIRYKGALTRCSGCSGLSGWGQVRREVWLEACQLITLHHVGADADVLRSDAESLGE